MRRSLVRLLAVIAVVAAIVVAGRMLPVEQWTERLSGAIRGMGVWGPVAYGAVYVVATLLLIPGSIITLGAGGLFGLAVGTAVVSFASTIGAALAFLIARYALRDRVRGWIAESPRLAAVDGAIGREGWKVVALLRLSPAVPFNILNYLCGVTSVRFWPYVAASWVAMLPATLMYVYLGAIGTEAVTNRTATAGTWALRIAGLAATVAVTWFITRTAQRAMRGRLETPQSSGTGLPAGPTDPLGEPLAPLRPGDRE